ncbi:MAG: hypothetical protein F6K14_00635 [Symploca sp. SIO2C1]|nr:hypothetical protein [Symploca sp. SIO2C1]
MSVVQIQYAQNNEFKSKKCGYSWDDSVPNLGGGLEVLKLSIDPVNRNNKLLVQASIHVVEETNTSDHIIVALFKDNDLGAVATAVEEVYEDYSQYGGLTTTVNLTHVLDLEHQRPVTLTIEVGLSGEGKININGGAGSRKLGGSLHSTLVVTEFTP